METLKDYVYEEDLFKCRKFSIENLPAIGRRFLCGV